MPNEKEITLFIVLVVFAILFLIVIIAFSIVWSKRNLLKIEKEKQKELIRAIIQTEETQKTKIAHDLHNQIIPILALTGLNLNTKIIGLKNGSQDFLAAKAEVDKLGAIADSIREIAHGLIPKMFASSGLIKSIENVVKQLDNIDDTTALFKNNTQYQTELPLSMVDQVNIYNAGLEILNNLRKHGKYKALTVCLEGDNEFFNLMFVHDGIGITNDEILRIAKTKKGIGLISLQSIAIALEGEIDYKKEKDISSVCLKFPIKNDCGN